MVKKMFIEIRLCNLTHAFKGNVKFAKIYMVKFKSAVADMRYFARSKFSRSLVHKKKFSMIRQVVFELGYVFCQEM